MYPYFAQKTMDIQSKPKDVMYPLDENTMNIQLWHSQSQFCNVIELK